MRARRNFARSKNASCFSRPLVCPTQTPTSGKLTRHRWSPQKIATPARVPSRGSDGKIIDTTCWLS
eukprot:1127352-Amphidinium_carterae.1